MLLGVIRDRPNECLDQIGDDVLNEIEKMVKNNLLAQCRDNDDGVGNVEEGDVVIVKSTQCSSFSKYIISKNEPIKFHEFQSYIMFPTSLRSFCRSKLHDESRLIQEVLMITKMMTKSLKVKIESRTLQESREI